MTDTTLTMGMELEGGGVVTLDLDVLLETRLLITATPGGGKSGTVYQLCEQAVDKVQVLILDKEGEYAPLRAKYPFVYVGPEGDALPSPETAELLARTLLEAGASAIIDLYEMQRKPQHEFVREFLAALTEAPKDLWPVNRDRATLVIIDEAHLFVPEQGETPSVATDAVEAMASRGRKRGYGLVLVTQRLAMMSKNAAAMCQNALVGRTSQIDEERAAKQLRIGGKAAKEEFFQVASRTRAGEFFAYGMAFGRENVVRFQVNRAETLPEKRGRVLLAPPPAPEAIRGLLPALKALPQEAEKQRHTVDDLLARVNELETALGQAERKGVVPMEIVQQIAELTEKAKRADELEADHARFIAHVEELAMVARSLERVVALIQNDLAPPDVPGLTPEEKAASAARATQPREAVFSAPEVIAVLGAAELATKVNDARREVLGVNAPQQKILDAIATLVALKVPYSTQLVALTAGTTARQRGFEENVRVLKNADLIRTRGGTLELTPKGAMGAVAEATIPEMGAVLGRLHLSRPQMRMALLIAEGENVPEALAEAMGTTVRARGFEENLRKLKSEGYVEKASGCLVLARFLMQLPKRTSSEQMR